jgi:hypothetical protein
MKCESQPEERLVSLTVRNVRPAEIVFYLEPWGEEYRMPPGAMFRIVAQGPQGDLLEVEVGDGSITAYGWPGSVVSLFDGDVELGAGSGERTPVPNVPQSSTVATFLRTILGKPVEPQVPPPTDIASGA